MFVSQITAQNFKNLSGNFNLSPGINLIIGPNGRGKTNFLEMTYFLGRGKSFKGTSDQLLINMNAPSEERFSKVSCTIKSEGTETLGKFIIGEQSDGFIRKTFFLNDLKVSKQKFMNNLAVILFTPDDLNMMNGTPEIRRNLLDEYLELTLPHFAELRQSYRKILMNRNKLLKAVQKNFSSENELDFWDEKLIKLGSEIIKLRIDLLRALRPVFHNTAHQLFREKFPEFEIKYISKLCQGEESGIDEIYANFSYKVKDNRGKEIVVGQTLYGPQRDDIAFLAKDMDFHSIGSRGQQRMVSVAFKIATWWHYFEKFDKKPILLLDDVMSELDDSHRSQLEQKIRELDCQAIYTSTNREEFSLDLLSGYTVIEV